MRQWLPPLLLGSAVVIAWALRGVDPGVQAVAPAVALQAVQSGLTQPVWVGVAPGEPDRLYIAQRGGKVLISEKGRLLDSPFVDLGPYLTAAGSEQGLLALAFHPDWAKNGRVYVRYTGKLHGEQVLARLQRDPSNPNRIDLAKQAVILTVEQPYPNHNGGWLDFGPDGYLYTSIGDGGSAGDPQNRAQNLNELHGKILRIEVGDFEGYRIPASNPFVGKGGRGEIWAYGLRNPWRDSFDKATGDLWIGDVGQSRVEEIDRIPAGKGGLNFGWRIMEGNKRFAPGSTEGLTPPVATYTHEEGGCAVMGGYVYRGSAIPALVGSYLFGDHCSGKLWRLAPGSNKPELLMETGLNISGFGLDGQGEILLVDLNGSVNRLMPK